MHLTSIRFLLHFLHFMIPSQLAPSNGREGVIHRPETLTEHFFLCSRLCILSYLFLAFSSFLVPYRIGAGNLSSCKLDPSMRCFALVTPSMVWHISLNRDAVQRPVLISCQFWFPDCPRVARSIVWHSELVSDIFHTNSSKQASPQISEDLHECCLKNPCMFSIGVGRVRGCIGAACLVLISTTSNAQALGFNFFMPSK